MIGKVRDVGYVHFKSQLTAHTDQVQIKAKVTNAADLKEVLKLSNAPLEFVGVMADAVMLKYNTTTNEFELVLFYGDCCDSSTYLFK